MDGNYGDNKIVSSERVHPVRPISTLTNSRSENILCAVLALLKELDESGLELVKREIERKLLLSK